MTKVDKVKVVDNIREVATVFENCQNVAYDFFSILAFLINFCPPKMER